ncbi:MAG: TRAP transporter small permease [Alphaproteobacteria bacterium]
MGADYDPTATGPVPKTRVPLKLEEVAIAAGMAGIALITFANVVARYLTDVSLAFTEEYSVVLMVVVAILGTSLALAGGRHIRIGYFVDERSAPTRKTMELIAMGLTIICFGAIAIYGAQLTWDEYRFEVLSPGLGEPQWIYTGTLPLLSLVVIARAIGRAIRIWRGEAA